MCTSGVPPPGISPVAPLLGSLAGAALPTAQRLAGWLAGTACPSKVHCSSKRGRRALLTVREASQPASAGTLVEQANQLGISVAERGSATPRSKHCLPAMLGQQGGRGGAALPPSSVQ